MSEHEFPTIGPDGAPATGDVEPGQLPYGGDLHDFMLEVAASAIRAERRFNEVLARTVDDEGPMSPADTLLSVMSSVAMANAYGVVALLKLFQREHSDDAARDAAAMVQFMYHNGGMGKFEDDADVTALLDAAKTRVLAADAETNRCRQKIEDDIRVATARHTIQTDWDTLTAVCPAGDFESRRALERAELISDISGHLRGINDRFAEKTDFYDALRKHLAVVHGLGDVAYELGDLEALREHEDDHDKKSQRSQKVREHDREWWGLSRQDIIRAAAAAEAKKVALRDAGC